jgi:hypothetical protein
MSRTQGQSELDSLVDDYLRDLEHALAGVEESRRTQLVQEIRQHIAELRTEQLVQSSTEMKNLLDRVGEPGDIAAAALVDEQGGSESKKSRSAGKMVLAAVGTAVVVVLGVVLVLTLSNVSHSPASRNASIHTTTIVPNVVGMTQAEAEVTVQAAGLNVAGMKDVRSQSGVPGTVVAQSPPSGTQVKTRAAVTLSVSSGPRPG